MVLEVGKSKSMASESDVLLVSDFWWKSKRIHCKRGKIGESVSLYSNLLSWQLI